MSIYGNEGWGGGPWGISTWGPGIPHSPPTITPITPLPDETGVPQSLPLRISFTDESQVIFNFIRITIGGVIYFSGGVALNGANVTTEVNAGNGFDFEVRTPEKYPIRSRQEVTVYAVNFNDEISELVYYFSVGIEPKLISVSNPSPGILLAHFNEPMLHDAIFLSPSSWTAEATTSSTIEIEITNVYANPTHAGTAVLHYVGGGGIYELTVNGVSSSIGGVVEKGNNTAIFELIYGDEEIPSIRLFDTIFGPVGISQRTLNRRTMDDHVSNRSIAIGMDEQFRLRLQNLDGSARQDSRPGIRRT